MKQCLADQGNKVETMDAKDGDSSSTGSSI